MRLIVRRVIVIAIIAFGFSIHAQGQKLLGLKGNIPHWATVTPNLGVEVAFRYRMTFELSGGYNPFTFKDGQQWKHWVIWPEIRYWPWEAFNGHSIGLHGVFAEFDVGGLDLPVERLDILRNRRYKGDFKGLGLSYGYAWIIGNSLLLEATAGAGYARLNYDGFSKGGSGQKLNEGRKHYIGPTKAALSLVYLF